MSSSIDAVPEGINRVGILDSEVQICAACGKESNSGDMNTCNKCKSVKYCNAACKKKHRKKHKKTCEKRVAELHDEELFKEVEPNECPLCFLPMPLDSSQCTFQPCCGKSICNGCMYAMKLSEGKDLCAFCRMPPTCSDEEKLNRLKKLMDNGNADAYLIVAFSYAIGINSLPQDWNNANKLCLKAGELGCAEAYCNIGKSYKNGMGVERDIVGMCIGLNQCTFQPCCGKSICNGCMYAMKLSEGKDLCAFCRMPPTCSDEEKLNRLKKLMDNGNADAYLIVAFSYAIGINSLPQDWNNANKLCLKAGELGCAEAYCNIGKSYKNGMGVERDIKKAKHYHELAAMKGYVQARQHLGYEEWEKGNKQRAMKHFLIAARAGDKTALEGVLKLGYKHGIITKEEYGDTLRAYHKRQKEMKSDTRDKAAASGWSGSG